MDVPAINLVISLLEKTGLTQIEAEALVAALLKEEAKGYLELTQMIQEKTHQLPQKSVHH